MNDKNSIDIRDHLNLINNHGYKGSIAIYNGPRQASTNTGDIVLVQDKGDSDAFYTIERPLSQDAINKEKGNGSLLKTVCTCVGVPKRFLNSIYI